VAVETGVTTGAAAPKTWVTLFPLLFAIHTPPVWSIATALGALRSSAESKPLPGLAAVPAF
jgi:hypothetical protein